MTTFDPAKSLQEIEGSDWGEPTFDSYPVTAVHHLRRKPLNELSVEDLRVMIGQDVGVSFLMDFALKELEKNPLAEGNHYPGDLLAAVLTVKEPFWRDHPEWLQRAKAVVAQVRQLLPEMALPEQRGIEEVLQHRCAVTED